jgi:hypothetical protein
MQLLLKHKLLIGAVAIVVAASAGGAYAATQSGTNPRQAYLNDVAKRLNVTPTQLRAAMKGALLDRLDAAVKAGTLSQAQADRIKQRIEQGGMPLLDRRLFGPRGLGPRGFGPPAPGPLGRASTVRGAFAAAATYLGLSDAQLLSDLSSGKTLAQVANAQGKSVSGLENAITDAVKSRLNGLVASGWVTKAKEQRVLNRLSARIDRLVNHAHLHGPGMRHLRAVPGPAALPGGPPAPGGPAGPGAPALIAPPAGPPPAA